MAARRAVAVVVDQPAAEPAAARRVAERAAARRVEAGAVLR